MPFNGAGSFNVYTPGNPVITATTISSTAFNATMADFAAGLSNAMPRDGQGAATANIPFGGFKATGLGVGTLRTDGVNLGQLQDSAGTYLTAVAGTNTITATLNNLASYTTGQTFRFIAAGANTGAVTLNINALGAKVVTKGGAYALDSGDIGAGQICVVTYDGTQFQLTVQPVTSINGGQLAGLRNRLINPRFDVWQRGTSFAVTSAAVVYTADRWFGNAGGATAATYSQQNSSSINQYGIRVQRNSGSTSTQTLNLRQIVESLDARTLQNITVTISATLTAGANFSAASSQVFLLLTTGTGSDQGSASLLAGSWTGSTNVVNTAVTISATATRYSATVTLPAGVQEIAAGIYYVPVGTAGANDWVQVDTFQLEVGSVATTFEQRPIGMELALCQRYYAKSYAQGTTPGTNIVGTLVGAVFTSMCEPGTSVHQLGNVKYPQTMRTGASVVYYDMVGTISNFSTITGGGLAVVNGLGAVSSIYQNDSGFSFSALPNTTRAAVIAWTASSEL